MQLNKNRSSKSMSSQWGQSFLELGLVVPIIIIFTFGMVATFVGMTAWGSINQAAADAAAAAGRDAGNNGRGTPGQSSCYFTTTNSVIPAIQAALATEKLFNISLVETCSDANDTALETITCTNVPLTGNGAICVLVPNIEPANDFPRGGHVTVTVTAQVSLAFVAYGSPTLKGTGKAQIEPFRSR